VWPSERWTKAAIIIGAAYLVVVIALPVLIFFSAETPPPAPPSVSPSLTPLPQSPAGSSAAPATAPTAAPVSPSPPAPSMPTTSTPAAPTAVGQPKPKDGWDKVQAISGYFAAGAIALLSVVATSIFAERTRRTTDTRAQDTLAVSRAAALGNLVPHLSSDSPVVRRNALIALEVLGHRQLFLDLATTIGDEAAVSAVAHSVISEDTRTDRPGPEARVALTELVSAQAQSTFRIGVSEDRIVGTAFITLAPHVVVTTAHVVGDIRLPPPIGRNFTLTKPHGPSVQCALSYVDQHEDVAVLIAPEPVGPSLQLAPRDSYNVSSEVIRIHGDGRVDPGTVLGPWEEATKLPGSDNIVTTIASRPGDSGAPVFDPAGHVVGMVRAYTRGDEFTVLIPAHVIEQVLQPTIGSVPV
jgi:S1-C subfamily serine protease